MEIEEPMDVDAVGDFDKFDDLLEEGECREYNNHISRKILPSVVSIPENRFENKAGTFITAIDIFSNEVKLKMEERAKRFGIVKDTEKSGLKDSKNLYESFGINEETTKNFRLNVIHMRGTENMNTKDIFKYFEDYVPASIEWINDISCNVVWLDKPSAARAILGLSKRIVGIKKEQNSKTYSDDSNDDSAVNTIINEKQYKDENVVNIRDIRCPLPPGIWRKGNNYVDSRNIFLRFATRFDKKQLHDEKISEIYIERPRNQGGLKGILTSSRKRLHKQLNESSPKLKEEKNTNGIAAKNPWGSLSMNWGVTDFVEDDYLPKASAEPISNVKERLGFKTQEQQITEDRSNIIELSDESQSESSTEEEDWCKRSKMPRMRMHADDEEEKIQKRKGKIRNMANHGTKFMENDLRGKLTAKRRLPTVYPEAIQVVVTNPKAVKDNLTNANTTEDENDNEDEVNIVQAEILQQEDDNEEGEIVESESDSKEEYEEEVEEEEIEEVEEIESESDNGSSESSLSEKEVQGLKGSVIKVVQHKPKLASTVSTVWSRLNHSKIDKNDNNSQERYYSKTDLRYTLRKNDLRSRIGNHHMRGRSPLRIELRNDKYAGKQNDSE